MLKTDPKDSFLSYALALEYEKEGKVDLAINTIEDLMVEDPDYIGAYYKLGQLYEGKENLSKARNIYQTGIKLADQQKTTKPRENWKKRFG